MTNVLINWMEEQDFYSNDWYDLTRNNTRKLPRYIKGGINRACKLFPETTIHSKPKTKASTTMGLMSSVYFMRGDIDKGKECLGWLLNISRPENGWGLPFTWYLPEGIVAEPNTGLTTIMPYILEGFERGYKTTKNERYLEAILKTEDFFINKLKYTQLNDGRCRSSYSPLDNFTIINASSYTALCLRIIHKYTKDKKLIKLSDSLCRYVESNQTDEGWWPYWEGHTDGIDSLHQMYILENLYQCGTKKSIINKGLDYLQNNLIDKNGIVMKFPNNHSYFELIDQAEYRIMMKLIKGETVSTDEVYEGFGIKNKPYLAPYIYHKRKIKIPFIRWGLAQWAYAQEYLKEGEYVRKDKT